MLYKLFSLLGLGVFLYAPIFVVFGSSFNSSRQMVFPPSDPSMLWYQAFFSDPSWTGALVNSVVIACVSSILAMALAVLVAAEAWRRNSKFSRFLVGSISLPFLIPGIVFAVSISLVASIFGLLGTEVGIILGHVALLVAIPLVTTQLGLSQIDTEHVDAATLMGLSERETLFRLVLPIVRPYVITGGLFALIISMNEYVVAFMLSGFSVETLPIKIYNSQRYGFEPTLSVGTIIYIGFSLIVLSYIAITGKLWSLLGMKHSE